MDISISEITQYQRCRRKWDINSPNRQALKPIALPRAVLSMGTFIHVGISAHTEGVFYKDAMFEAYQKELTKFQTAYVEAVGVGPDESELKDFKEQYEQSVRVVFNYLTKYGDTPTGDHEVLYSEQTFRVPIPTTDHFLVGTFDRIMRAKTGDIVVGEIKTYDRRPSFESLMYRPQFVAYSWAVGQLMGDGKHAPFIMYDGISRKLPKAPLMLKSGKLSTAWSDSLDFETYRDAILTNGLDESDYADILSRLRNRSEDPFYARYIIPVTQGQVESFVEQLAAIADEMASRSENGADLYPNYQMTCGWDCHVQNLCAAMQNREDYRSLIEAGYHTNKGNQTFQSRDGDEIEFAG